MIELKILLLEDNPGDVRLIQEFLKATELNFKLTVSERLRDAVYLLNNNEFDIILSDLGLPDCNGISTVKELIKTKTKAPVVVLTGLFDEQLGVIALREGAEDYLVKNLLTSYSLSRCIKYSLERKRLNKELKESIERHQVFINSIDEMAFLKDEQSKYILINKATLNFFGLDENAIIGKTDFELMSEEAAQNCLNSDLMALASDSVYISEEIVGEKILETHKFKVPLSDSKQGIGCYIYDITERKLSENKISESETKYRMLFESAPVGIGISNSDGCIVAANKIMQKINGYTIEELKEIKVSEIYVNSADRDYVLKTMQEHGKIEDYEVLLKRKNEEIYYALMNIDHVIINNEKMFLTSIRDITEKKKSEVELIIAKEKAEESDRLKTIFLANMSHEIRTPLNGIMGFADFLKNPGLDHNTTVEFVNIINSCSRQLMAIVGELVDISVIEAGQLKLIETECSLHFLMNELFNIYKSNVNRIGNNADNYVNSKKDILFELSLTADVEDLSILIDEVRLKQILSNLLNNSIKFTSKGKIEFGCKINTRHEVPSTKHEEILFFVKDTGIGISKDCQEIIFERFRQLEETSARKFGGLGLGLSIAKRLVEIMGGNIWLESEEGKGTTFYFTLPLKTAQPVIDDLNIKSNIQNSTFSIQHLKGKTILIAEDDYMSYYFMELLFKNSGAVILHVENGEEAIELCKRNNNIDLIFMDLQMPLMNGYEATKQIKSFYKDIPIIALTAYAMNYDKQKALDSGCNDYISKPAEKEIVYKMLEKYVKL